MKKILKYIYNKYPEFFRQEVKNTFSENIQSELVKADLTELFEKNKHFFELLMVKDFVGYIPKEISEPAVKIMEEQSEMFERWILWQSWFINRKAMNDPMKIPFYNGMMVYLKILYSIARLNKKNDIPKSQIKLPVGEVKVEDSWIEQALSGIQDFKIKLEERKNNDSKNDIQVNQVTENENV